MNNLGDPQFEGNVTAIAISSTENNCKFFNIQLELQRNLLLKEPKSRSAQPPRFEPL